MMEETIQALMDRGFDTYDLLAPSDPYKHEWAARDTAVSDHALPVNLRGVAHLRLYLKMIRPGMKSIYGHLPTPVRHRLNRIAVSA